ncbi:hypothetical protein HHI36_016935 [Cryptolaemus montrouzieri]|uniref:Uncharacterized protein n=1 Tax=Cryptolaemus montrouzieri TaxID=559131 RepID=A0ABD2NLL2_9CUCU
MNGQDTQYNVNLDLTYTCQLSEKEAILEKKLKNQNKRNDELSLSLLTQEHERDMRVGLLNDQILSLQQEILEYTTTLKLPKTNITHLEVEVTEIGRKKCEEIDRLRGKNEAMAREKERLNEKLDLCRKQYNEEKQKLECQTDILSSLKSANNNLQERSSEITEDIMDNKMETECTG